MKNKMNEMNVEKWCNEIYSRGKREKPGETTQSPFRPQRNTYGVTETPTLGPSGGRRVSNRLGHGAAALANI